MQKMLLLVDDSLSKSFQKFKNHRFIFFNLSPRTTLVLANLLPREISSIFLVWCEQCFTLHWILKPSVNSRIAFSFSLIHYQEQFFSFWHPLSLGNEIWNIFSLTSRPQCKMCSIFDESLAKSVRTVQRRYFFKSLFSIQEDLIFGIIVINARFFLNFCKTLSVF